MSDPHHREIDPVTGYDTTGHDWNGIKELNTPFPKFVIWILLLTFLYSVVAWILLPAWPLGRDYTRGLLGLDQGDMAVEGFRRIEAGRQDWMTPFAGGDFPALQSDGALMAAALPAAGRLFADNCAGCHSAAGVGGPGFPVLDDGHWLWGSTAEAIADTIRFGINTDHPDTRYAEMPAFNWLDHADRSALARYVAALPQGAARADSPAAALFEENCAACHGEDAAGGLENGAPSLVDAAVIYGQDSRTVMETLRHGRHGVMPAWAGRLSDAEINMLALYVAGLSQPDSGAAP